MNDCPSLFTRRFRHTRLRSKVRESASRPRPFLPNEVRSLLESVSARPSEFFRWQYTPEDQAHRRRDLYRRPQQLWRIVSQFLLPVPTCLLKDALESSRWNRVTGLAGYRHASRLRRMFELPMRPSGFDLYPTIGTEPPQYLDYFHVIHPQSSLRKLLKCAENLFVRLVARPGPSDHVLQRLAGGKRPRGTRLRQDSSAAGQHFFVCP